jgi:hypothetical protein
VSLQAILTDTFLLVFGSVLAWAISESFRYFSISISKTTIVAPALIQTGQAVGIQPDPENFPDVVSYFGLRFTDLDAYVNNPSPRYWLLWPGVLMMLVYSFVELFVNLAPIFRSKSSLAFSNNSDGLIYLN